ncbi:MAG: hypothetical protein WCT24_03345 [Patescibacteria group bacterium]|jgi:hypothetical protein
MPTRHLPKRKKIRARVAVKRLAAQRKRRKAKAKRFAKAAAKK